MDHKSVVVSEPCMPVPLAQGVAQPVSNYPGSNGPHGRPACDKPGNHAVSGSPASDRVAANGVRSRDDPGR